MAKVLHLVTKEAELLCLDGDPMLPEEGEDRVQVGQVGLCLGGEYDEVVSVDEHSLPLDSG